MEEPSRFSTSTTLTLARARVAREVRRVRASLFVERVIAGFWPVWAVFAAFLGLALLGVFTRLAPFWHAAALLFFALAAVILFSRAALTLRAPTRPEALARLDAGARGRPAQSFEDTLTAGAADAGTSALWAAHQRQMAARAAALRAAPPDLRASQHDRYALRHAGLLTLAAGALAWLAADGVQLADQLTPGAIAAGPAAPEMTLEAWASPPVYTGMRAVYLTRIAEGETVPLPVGSTISLRVFDTDSPPRLTQTAGSPADFADQGAGVFDASFTITTDGMIRVEADGDVAGAWAITALPDAPPTIAFDGIPHGGERGALTLPFTASDDYGVQSATGEITLDLAAAPSIPGLDHRTGRASVYPPIALELPMPLTGSAAEIAETLVEDLTAHPWAGLPVTIRLTATDAADQRGSAESTAILPARRFFHPLAKALVEQRRHLALSPDTAPRVLDVLEAVMIYPEEVFDDTTAYLAARMAVRRLGYALEDNRLEAETPGIVDLLWKAAIRLEDGDLSSAAERLARAEERLREAIENGATDEELAELMQDLREAMRDFMAEMMQEALRDQANGEQPPQQDGESQTLTQQDLEEMLNQLEEAIRNGEQELARQMLQALQQMMNNMQMAQPSQSQPGEGEQMMDQMGDMMQEQQGLADRSFNEMQQGQSGQGQPQPGQNGQSGQGTGEPEAGEGGPGSGQNSAEGDSTGQIARDQQALRDMLDTLRRNMPGAAGNATREALDEAERAMNDAIENLENGDARSAVDDQVRALDSLREGRRSLGQDLADADAEGQGEQAGREGQGRDAREEDPLGRPTATDGQIDGDSVRVPGAALGTRARELQEEIRRRSGEPTRPPEELDYLDRLLDRF